MFRGILSPGFAAAVHISRRRLRFVDSTAYHHAIPSPFRINPMTSNSNAVAKLHGEVVPMSRAEHDRMANAIRALAMDAVEQAKSGHPGLPMGAADIATVLFTQFLKYDIADTKWPDRDRFILSAGHGSMLIYSVLHLLGSEAVTIEQLKNFRKLGSITAGHPRASGRPDRRRVECLEGDLIAMLR